MYFNSRGAAVVLAAGLWFAAGPVAHGADLKAAKPAVELKEHDQQPELNPSQQKALKERLAPAESPGTQLPAVQKTEEKPGGLKESRPAQQKPLNRNKTLETPDAARPQLKPQSPSPEKPRLRLKSPQSDSPAAPQPTEPKALSAPGQQPGGKPRLQAPGEPGKTRLPGRPQHSDALRKSVEQAGDPPERRARRIITKEEVDRYCGSRWECDADGDGHRAAKYHGDDCNDDDPNTFPGNAEVADYRGHDEDCDPSTIDSGTRLHAHSGDGDKDKDTFIDERVANYGYGHHVPERDEYHSTYRDGRGYYYGTDCDDTRPDVHPQQIEVRNGRDDNCNGEVDEGLR